MEFWMRREGQGLSVRRDIMTITSVPFGETPLNRRSLLKAATITGGAVALGDLFPAWAKSGSHGLHSLAGQSGVVSGDTIELSVGQSAFKLGNKTGHAYTVNGTLPGPLVRLREGQNVKLIVRNTLQEDTSVHWHGMLLPFQMDGVPGISFPGIGPGESFTYEFPMRQHGTYWYHSHSHMQEAMGMYGALIVDPAGKDPIVYDREHVLVLSDQLYEAKAEGGLFQQAQADDGRVAERQRPAIVRARHVGPDADGPDRHRRCDGRLLSLSDQRP
jgi:FtsP/CotA-like multicopper oxidase with cupredoxin domain